MSIQTPLRVIGIAGKKQTGKSTFGSVLTTLANTAGVTATQTAFATPLKQICHIMFGGTEAHWYGDAKMDSLTFWADKNLPVQPYPRHLMQYVGTEVMRHHISSDIWLHVLHARITAMREEDPALSLVVIDDVRFANEAEFIADTYGGYVVELVRPVCDVGGIVAHSSEHGLPTSLVRRKLDCTRRELYDVYAAGLLQELRII